MKSLNQISAHNRETHQSYSQLINAIIDREKDSYVKAQMINAVNEKLLWAVQDIKDLSSDKHNQTCDPPDTIDEQLKRPQTHIANKMSRILSF